jgi:TPR repeat protein
MKRAALTGLAALAAIAFAMIGPAHAQDVGAEYTRAVDMIETQPEAALALLKPLAEGGHAPSMAALGSMLANGAGAPQDLAAGRDWYRRAAEAGSVTGVRAYGGMLLQGEGGPKDAALGIGLLLIAADAGDENAQVLLSLVREDEDPGEEAVIEARNTWLKARVAELDSK